jgi:hypothetical protein
MIKHVLIFNIFRLRKEAVESMTSWYMTDLIDAFTWILVLLQIITVPFMNTSLTSKFSIENFYFMRQQK